MRHTIVITLLLALAAMASDPLRAAAQAPAGEQLLVPLARSTPVDEYAGWLLFSRWDGAGYRLSTWRDGAVRDLPVRSQATPFDADLGPDSSGRPSVAVSLCDGSCDLFVIGLEVGDRLRPVRNANTNGHDEIAPTVWKGRLAFGRRYDADTVIAYTKRLNWPRERPSDRLAGLPARRCGAVDPPDCRRIEDENLVAMDLWGRWVAQSWTYQPDRFPGFRQNEIRLTNLARTDTRQMAYMGTGLGGQTYLGRRSPRGASRSSVPATATLADAPRRTPARSATASATAATRSTGPSRRGPDGRGAGPPATACPRTTPVRAAIPASPSRPAGSTGGPAWIGDRSTPSACGRTAHPPLSRRAVPAARLDALALSCAGR